MILSLVITVFSFLLFVDYEWCHVLFKNNTVISFISSSKVNRKAKRISADTKQLSSKNKVVLFKSAPCFPDRLIL